MYSDCLNMLMVLLIMSMILFWVSWIEYLLLYWIKQGRWRKQTFLCHLNCVCRYPIEFLAIVATWRLKHWQLSSSLAAKGGRDLYGCSRTLERKGGDLIFIRTSFLWFTKSLNEKIIEVSEEVNTIRCLTLI